jgi:hypothetical protein
MKNITTKISNLARSISSLIGRVSIKNLIVFISLQFLVAFIAFVFFGWLPVRREAKKISSFYSAPQAEQPNELMDKKIELISNIYSTEHLEAILKANLTLSKTDSIALLIDLKDSLAILSFKGIAIFESKIANFGLNKGLIKIPTFLRDSLFSGPMMVDEEVSSIEKFPIVVKKAPKDTTEANLLSAAPTLPTHSDVFFFFAFNRNILIEVKQQEPELVGSFAKYQLYKKMKRNWVQRKNINALKNSLNPSYLYVLTIEIPREDARSIYRALPIKPYVLIRY